MQHTPVPIRGQSFSLLREKTPRKNRASRLEIERVYFFENFILVALQWFFSFRFVKVE